MMKSSFKLAWKYLIKNKKRSLGIIIGISIVTILLSGSLIISNVYQNYIINIIRENENWEVKFKNIEYEKLYGLENNSDIKEISLTKNIGNGIIMDQVNATISKHVEINAYDDNAFKAFGIKLIYGRMPQNDKEIIISKNFNTEEDFIAINIDENIIEYKIVGIIEPTEYDNIDLDEITIGAFTYLNKENLSSQTLINANINYYDISDIYDKSTEIANVLELYSSEEESKDNIIFNEDLIQHYSIWNMNSDVDRKIVIGLISATFIILSISIAFIYSIFNISIQERKKDFAVLNSIGATHKQIFKMCLCEILILLAVSIIIGVLIDVIIFYGNKEFISNNLLALNIDLEEKYINTYVDIPYKELLLTMIIVIVTTTITGMIPVIKKDKNSIIEKIRGKNKLRRIEKKKINKLLAYRLKKNSNSKYGTVIFSIAISVFLILLTQGIVKNVYSILSNSTTYNYTVDVESKYVEEVLNEFYKTGTIETISSYFDESVFIQIEDKDINISLKKAMEDVPLLKERIFFTSINNELKCNMFALSNVEFENYLKENGVKKLNDNECILVNYSNAKTDYYNGIYMTNYKDGDSIDIYLNSKGDGTFEIESFEDILNVKEEDIQKYGDTQRKIKLKIAKVVNNLPNCINNNHEIPSLSIIVSEKTLNDAYKYLINGDDTYNDALFRIEVYSTNRQLLDEALERIKIKNGITDQHVLEGIYLSPNEKLAQIVTLKNILCIITALITILTLINIVNVIFSDINSRKQYFAILTSIGMTKKQLLKMILEEYGKYCIVSLLVGIILSQVICYMGYINIFDHELYKFKIPFLEIVVIIFIIIFILILILLYIDKVLKKNSIIDILKEREK